jgi:hypothetical protein
VTLAVVEGVQALALVVLLFLRRSTRQLYNNEQNVDGIFWEPQPRGLRSTLLEEQEWRNSLDSRHDLEERRS